MKGIGKGEAGTSLIEAGMIILLICIVAIPSLRYLDVTSGNTMCAAEGGLGPTTDLEWGDESSFWPGPPPPIQEYRLYRTPDGYMCMTTELCSGTPGSDCDPSFSGGF